MNNAEYADIILKALASKLSGEVQDKHDLPSGFAATTNLLTGSDGIFGQPGLERDVLATRIKPRGLNSVLPFRATNLEDPIYPYLTGFTDEEDASEPTGSCDDPIEAGQIKSAMLGAVFGKVRRKTEVIDLSELGQIGNRGELQDQVLINDPLGSGDFAVPDGVDFNFARIFRSAVAARIAMVGVSFQNKLGQLNWTGDPANNTSGGYAEYQGLETLVGTGKTDIITSASVPSLDSDVKDFNYATVESDSAELFEVMTMLYRFVKHNAIHMGFTPVQWIWVMRGEAWNQIVDVWPLVYASYRGDVINSITNQRNGTDAMAIREMSDNMREGMYLLIDGVRLPVVIDDYLPEATSTTDANVPEASYASDIYLLPMTVRGGYQTLYLEYFNFNGQNAAFQAINDGNLGEQAWTSDAGRFLWTNSHTSHCFAWESVIKPRLILRAPHLAGRLQNVVYSPLQHFRNPHPDDAYFVNGGNTAAHASFKQYTIS